MPVLDRVPVVAEWDAVGANDYYGMRGPSHAR
jgi:hypothetical protein